jgi:hypothetical protein
MAGIIWAKQHGAQMGQRALSFGEGRVRLSASAPRQRAAAIFHMIGFSSNKRATIAESR